MLSLALHHVSVPTANLTAACEFYEQVLGLRKLPRPPFQIEGAWYRVGPLQIHVTAHAGANFRTGRTVDNDDVHFALRAEDFEDAVSHLKRCGYDETLPDDHPRRLILKRTGLAGFPQVFLMDPDRNVIEINQAPFNAM
ncbi:VOC family protein [Nostoc sp. NIES-2111]